MPSLHRHDVNNPQLSSTQSRHDWRNEPPAGPLQEGERVVGLTVVAPGVRKLHVKLYM